MKNKQLLFKPQGHQRVRKPAVMPENTSDDPMDNIFLKNVYYPYLIQKQIIRCSTKNRKFMFIIYGFVHPRLEKKKSKSTSRDYLKHRNEVNQSRILLYY
ncbi:hypothetical protein PanWU01x14_212050 [Parasponia andersonii]|uniref:Uncharacterized protein n=1 Tax=Parasponia andersonii TaxID=3476 RepID=A0A2P5BT29_PARAD|nr:hypothetical protein PanWU01x14_212050 [Parasponia andersonii]